jgi:hypothetical protein
MKKEILRKLDTITLSIRHSINVMDLNDRKPEVCYRECQLALIKIQELVELLEKEE